MIEINPTSAMTNAEIEAWFAEAGLAAIVVDRCPAPACALCAVIPDDDLAEAA
jgi:hypothetical protein